MRSSLLSALGASILLALPAGAQERSSGNLDWRGSVNRGDVVRVHAFQGAVRVEPASGSTVEAHGEVRGTSAERDRVIFEVLEVRDGVVICARTERSRCTEDGLRSEDRSWRDSERTGTVTLTVRLPRGVDLVAASGNGAVTVERAGGDVRASSGNGAVSVNGADGAVRASSGNGTVTVSGAHGGVQASTGNGKVSVETSQGPVRASSGNGNVEVHMASLQGNDDMQFSTGNGRVTIWLPSSFDGQLDMTTGHGDAYTDFPITISGRLQKNRLRGTIGSGRGPSIRLTSGNGDLEVRKNQ